MAHVVLTESTANVEAGRSWAVEDQIEGGYRSEPKRAPSDALAI
jgi:hypothetical protein